MIGILTWLTLSISTALHPFYISMTDVNFNNRTKTVEVSVRIFTDDFEKTLRKNCNCKVDLQVPQDKKAMDNLINTYILKHLQVKVDGQLKTLQFSGYQKEEESTWCYFEVKNIDKLNRIELKNSILHDYKQEQINMIHVKANGKEVTDKLDYPNTNYNAQF